MFELLFPFFLLVLFFLVLAIIWRNNARKYEQYEIYNTTLLIKPQHFGHKAHSTKTKPLCIEIKYCSARCSGSSKFSRKILLRIESNGDNPMNKNSCIKRNRKASHRRLASIMRKELPKEKIQDFKFVDSKK